MEISTKSDEIDATRRFAIELLLSGHQVDCGTCVKYLNCELQALKQYLIGDEFSLRRRPRLFGMTVTDPIFTREPNKCVLCGRCVRACHELRGVGILYYKRSRDESYIGVGPDPGSDAALADAGCRFCGACAEVCPTGAILDREEFGHNKSRKEALLPCANTCPAEIDVPRYIRHIREGDIAAAVAVIREKVPFPRVLGYVCSHPCESVCRRGQINNPVSICRLKRYAADNEGARSWAPNAQKKPGTGKRVAVIGAGPAGLTAAYYLTLLGHSATVFDVMPEPGGMLRYGIPEYKLPPGVLEQEIGEITSAGVSIKTDTMVESVDSLLNDGFDAVLASIGAQKGVLLRIPGAKGDNVYTGTEFLKAARSGVPVKPLGSVMVLGGGNVAFDCARTACRLGAKEVKLACLESREIMLASPEEIAAGEEEGISIYPSRSIRRIKRDDGRIVGVEFLDVTSLSYSYDKTPMVGTVEGSDHMIKADCVIFSVGQKPEIPECFGVDITDRGFIDTNPSNMVSTSREGVFAASDAVTGTDMVISAITAGRKAAQAIDKFLGGRGRLDQKLELETEPQSWLGPIEDFTLQCRTPENLTPPVERVLDFRTVEQCLEKTEALYEAGRCLQCDLRLKMKQEKFWSSY